MGQPGSPPRRMSRPSDESLRERSRRAVRPERPQPPGWQRDAFAIDTDPDLPSWAGPDNALRSGRLHGRAHAPDPYAGGYAGEAGGRPEDERDGRPDGAADVRASGRARRQGRAAAARLRKSRRRVYRWTGVGIVLCVVGAAIAVILTNTSPKPLPYVTTLLHGEFKSVPNACTSVSATVLAQYLPGQGRTTTNELSGGTQSQCSFTVDAKPVFRLLEVSAQAYQPFAAASGNGSASANARDNMALTRAGLAQPPAKSPLSAAQFSSIANLGQQAFASYQQEKAGGITSNVVTVVVLERNVLITVQLSAQESGGFAPASATTLQAGASAAAADVLAKVKAQPKA